MHPGRDLCLGALGVLLQVEVGEAVVELEGIGCLVGLLDLLVDGGGVAPEALRRPVLREEASRDGKGGARDVDLAELTRGGNHCHRAELVHGERAGLELLLLPNGVERRGEMAALLLPRLLLLLLVLLLLLLLMLLLL